MFLYFGENQDVMKRFDGVDYLSNFKGLVQKRRNSIANALDPDSNVQGANMGPTWVLSAPDGPYDGPMNLAVRGVMSFLY